ncbi:MAG: response regulator [Planctomycetota bacterium]|jgi:twitching motility two-component system response regulator PilH|nr:response regulator [Planctomycetota bacterium]
MAEIALSLADEKERIRVAAGLRQRGYGVSFLSPAASGGNHETAAREIVGSGADVLVTDYHADDAISVKTLQAAAESEKSPHFIFVLPEATPIQHILMAVNEGADAFLERPVRLDALANYIERAIKGPSRRRGEENREAVLHIEAKENETKLLRRRLSASCRLISYLLSVPKSSQKRTVLIVSDSAYQRDSLKKLFEDHEFQTDWASGPKDGLPIALEKRPRIVVSDLEMEGKNGMEFCRELKIVHRLIPCHFVICTSAIEKYDQIMAPGNGVDACISKPENEEGNRILVAGAAMGLLLQE